MPRYSYERLTALDNSFLVLEQPDAYMHVASTQTFDAGPLKRSDGGIDADRIKKLIASALHRIPRYRQKLVWTPIYNNPVWVDDDRFNLDFHVRHTSLPRPGDEEQLKLLSARIMQQHLDRRRPLWEMWIVEGLEGDRMAIVSKVHHCMIDGVSGVDIMMVLMSLTPDPVALEPAQPYIPRPAPSSAELIRHESMRWASLPLRALRGVGHLVSEAQDLRRQMVTASRAAAVTFGSSLRPPSATPINGRVGPHRRFNWMRMDLAEIKKMRKVLGGSLNDVVLTIVTGAVRRLMIQRQVRPEELDFRIMAPVSVRSADEEGKLGNRVSAWIVELPIGEEDPVKQLTTISARTHALKEAKGAVAAEMLMQAAEWTPSTVLSLAGRNVSRMLPFNMVVTNVPGPQFPVYLDGAKLLDAFPHVPLTDSLGLGIALMSYDGKLCWGFNADYDLVPDLAGFAADVQAAFEDLRKLVPAPAPETSSVEAKRSKSADGGTDGNGKVTRTRRSPGGTARS